MKKHLTLFTISFLLLAGPLYAQDCPVPTASEYLHGNNIRANIPGGGRLFYDGNDTGFEIVGQGTAPVYTILGQGLWLGALDAADDLKVAAQTYGFDAGRSDYFAGPLGADGTTNKTTCNQWDHVWPVYRHQIESHLQDLADNGIVDTPIPEILGWPGTGNPYFADIYGFELPTTSQGLAPFLDSDNDGIYDPMAGDYPAVPQSSLIPEQITWSIFNDAGNIHSESGGEPLQVEVHLTTWAFFCEDNPQLNSSIFTSYRLFNRGAETLDSLHLGLWIDYDLGCYVDDYIGSAPELNTIFAYNSSNLDENCGGVNGFKENPPVQAMTFLNKELSYAIYSRSGTVGNPPPSTFDPVGDEGIFRALTGYWRPVSFDGDPIPLTFGGNGVDPSLSNPITNFVFPGDPNDPEEWSALSAGVEAGDYRAIASINLGSLAPGAVEQVDAAYSFFREPGADYLGNVSAMYTGVEDLQAWYDGQFGNICSQLAVCQEDCVWPGDANADGIANHCDLLAIAVGENAEGPTQPGPSNWSPRTAENWEIAQLNGADYKHIDADGNGKISLEDFLITILNYNLTRPAYQPPPAEYREGPELVISPPTNPAIDFNNLSPGQFILAQVRLAAEIPGLAALAFSLEYDTNYFGDIWAEYNPNNFISTGSFFSDYSQPENNRVQLDFAKAIIDSETLFNIRIRVNSAFPNPLPADTTLIRFKNIKAVSSDGTEIEIGGTTVVARISGIMVDTEEVEKGSDIRLFPNPTRGQLELRFPGQRLSAIELLDARGKRVWQGNEGWQDSASLNFAHLPAGVYFLRAGRWVEKVVIGR